MPRTLENFSAIDPSEQKNLSFKFGTPGESTSPLAVGETVTSVTFQLIVVFGDDATPTSRLIGFPAVQVGGLIVTQKVGAFQSQSKTVYEIQATATTSNAQILTPSSHFEIN